MRLLAFILTFLEAAAIAAPSSKQSINIQGVLRDNQGNLQSLMAGMTVGFYPSQTATTPIYSQTFPTVPVVNGFFNIALEDPNDPMLSLGGQSDLWIGIQVAGDPMELPRQHLGTTPFALMCNTADTATNALAIGGVAVTSSPAPKANQVLTYSANGWTPGSQAGATATTTSNGLQWISGGGNNVISASITPPGPGRIVITATGDTFTFHNTGSQQQWFCCISNGSCLSPQTNYYIGASTPGDGTNDQDGFPISLSYSYAYGGSGGSALSFSLYCQINRGTGGIAVENLGMFATYFPNTY
jgi:hypothetical protein